MGSYFERIDGQYLRKLEPGDRLLNGSQAREFGEPVSDSGFELTADNKGRVFREGSWIEVVLEKDGPVPWDGERTVFVESQGVVIKDKLSGRELAIDYKEDSGV